jgi:hypothetical protein
MGACPHLDPRRDDLRSSLERQVGRGSPTTGSSRLWVPVGIVERVAETDLTIASLTRRSSAPRSGCEVPILAEGETIRHTTPICVCADRSLRGGRRFAGPWSAPQGAVQREPCAAHAAIMEMLVATASSNGVGPRTWLADLLARIALNSKFRGDREAPEDRRSTLTAPDSQDSQGSRLS